VPAVNGGVVVILVLISLAVAVLTIAGTWKVFRKAGKPGWWSLIPIVSTVVLIKIGGKPGWWAWLLLIPICSLFIVVFAYRGVARSFGKGVGFTLGLLFLGVIFWPILGFGSSTFTGIYGGSKEVPNAHA